MISNSLPFFFVSFANIPIHRSEIHIYKLKGPNDQLCNHLLESIDNSHGYSKSCLGFFNGSLYIFSFTHIMGVEVDSRGTTN